MTTIFTTIIDGLSMGSIYAVIALGYTMVYGIAKMLNFAHGDVIMVGAYAGIIAGTNLLLGSLISIVIAIVVCALLGFTIEKLAYKPLRNASSLAVLITAIGVSQFLQAVALLVFGSSRLSFPKLISLPTVYITESLMISGNSLFTMGISAIIMVALALFVKNTQTGRAMLAVSEDKNAARLMGINVNRTISITFIIGSALAAIAGICYGLSYTYIGPTTGAMPGIKAFVAAVIGGIGSIPGAMLGGIILGLVENFTKVYISTTLSDAVVFGVLIVVLLIKPTGILGKIRQEKV
ncbi:MAG: branched-chain amino acid ABC transporter permease [Bacillota bacterium]